MIQAKDWLEIGQKFHGHKCPAMPLGLRLAAAAMNKLGVERAMDGQLHAFIDIGENHCATCFADGVQVITGCTLGKGNIEKTHKGKWALTLVDKKNKKAVHVSAKGESMQMSKESPFITEYRSKGIPASQVPEDIAKPAIDRVMEAPDENLFNISDIFDYDYKEATHSFNGFICEECGDMTVMEYGRIKGDKKVCIDCAAKID